jgi:hypothetical protein
MATDPTQKHAQGNRNLVPNAEQTIATDDPETLGIIDDLDALAEFLLGRTPVGELARLDSDRALLVEDIDQRVETLSQHTEWDRRTLLSGIGCQLETKAELKVASREVLDNCSRFLAVLAQVVGLLDLVSDRRGAITACSSVVLGTGRTGQDLHNALPKSLLYFRLGEIDRAGRELRAAAGVSYSSERGDFGKGPLACIQSAHLSEPRMRIYLSGSGASILGRQVDASIREHLRTCSACAALRDDVLRREQILAQELEFV